MQGLKEFKESFLKKNKKKVLTYCIVCGIVRTVKRTTPLGKDIEKRLGGERNSQKENGYKLGSQGALDNKSLSAVHGQP